MNDAEIRESFHRNRLRRQHASANTLVVDELGLKHGKSRADIAVINGHLVGYEIKSDEDSLSRLEEQIKTYSDVFDRVSVIVGTKHTSAIRSHVPNWWGVIVAHRGPRGGVSFETASSPRVNPTVDPFSVAQLLWKNEAAEALWHLGVEQVILRQRREVLYERLANLLSKAELRRYVRECLKNRSNWRRQTRLSQCGGLSRPHAK